MQTLAGLRHLRAGLGWGWAASVSPPCGPLEPQGGSHRVPYDPPTSHCLFSHIPLFTRVSPIRCGVGGEVHPVHKHQEVRVPEGHVGDQSPQPLWLLCGQQTTGGHW